METTTTAPSSPPPQEEEDQSSVFIMGDATPDGSVTNGLREQRPPMIPVGITIAYRQQQGLWKEKPPEDKRKSSSSSLQVFLDSALIYSLCLILPSLLGYFYQVYFLVSSSTSAAATRDTVWSQLSSGFCEPTTYTGYFLSSIGWCVPPPPSLEHLYSHMAWSDSCSITVFSIVITLFRMVLSHWYVRFDDPEALEAMVRCKSMHLLSSDYTTTPVGTPVRTRRIVTETTGNAPCLPNLNEPREECKEPDMEQEKWRFHEEPTPSHKYAGPRYATALFRLTYSASAVVIALFFFRTADFWPWYVFGHGDSSQCWDLSGGLAVAMDSDFDQRNIYLKQYFLWQASYHWHSAAFHILSMLLLFLHPTKHHRVESLQKGTTVYIRRLFQHALAVALIGIAYVFSSLRRLGAIGLFAFDVSSCCLHLLQLCINAPEGSRLSRTSTIAGVFWILVVPSFVLARFAIFPAIWYSATFESTAWLKQLENTLWPGSAALIQYAIHFLMASLEILSAVYFQRLFNHAHVKRVLRFGIVGKNKTTDGSTTTGTPRKKLPAT